MALMFEDYPYAEQYWDFKNNVLNPYEISSGSHKKAYWVCPKCGRSFEREIRVYLSSNNRICAVCANKKIETGINDLFTLRPDLRQYWDFKNNTVNPLRIGTGSPKKVKWLCKNCKNSFEQSVISRINSTGVCSICQNKKIVKGINDIFTLRSDLEQYWDYKRNIIDPSTITLNSNTKAYWLCSKCGRSFERDVPDITNRGTVCAVCQNKEVVQGINDLATTHPHLLLIWNYEKNNELGIYPTSLTYGSEQPVWWKCPKGHEYKKTPNQKTTAQFGCPICNKKRQTSFPEQYFYLCLKDIYGVVFNRYKIDGIEVDIYLPEYKLGIEYDGILYHSEEDKIQKDIKKEEKLKQKGISLIRIREDNSEGVHKKDNIYKYKVNSFSMKDCKSWNIIIEDIVKNLNNQIGENKVFTPPDFLEISNRIVAEIQNQKYEGSLGYKFPELLKEWDYEKNGDIDPFSIAPGSHTPAWWVCEKGHSYNALISNRAHKTNPTKCPICQNKKLLVGYNDLESQNPILAKMFDIEKNGITPDKVIYGGKTEWFWVCEKGHTFKRSLDKGKRTPHICPECYKENRSKKDVKK